MADSIANIAPEPSVGNMALTQPGYFDLKGLALYSSCSVRWLRDRLVDPACPLPYHRVGGKVLVKKQDFDTWMSQFRTDRPTGELDDIVNGVIGQLYG
jgi:hypothetical protein